MGKQQSFGVEIPSVNNNSTESAKRFALLTKQYVCAIMAKGGRNGIKLSVPIGMFDVSVKFSSNLIKILNNFDFFLKVSSKLRQN